MAKNLFILNDPPYGTERSYNAARLARTLLNANEDVRVFLMGDAAACAAAGQKVPQGYYNLGDALGSISAWRTPGRSCDVEEPTRRRTPARSPARLLGGGL